MPLIIRLKEPPLNLIVEGEIKDEDEQRYDEIFHNQIFMVKSSKGKKNMVIPLLRECNIAIIQEVDQKDVDEMLEEQEKKAKQMSQQRGGPLISSPQYIFPGGRRGKG